MPASPVIPLPESIECASLREPAHAVLWDDLGSGYSPVQAEAIRRAYSYAVATPGELTERAVAVALVLKEILADGPTLQAALLVDTGLEQAAISAHFGDQVASRVRKVLQLERFTCPKSVLDQPRQAEMWRRLLLALANDVRPLLIVLTRRLETLRAAWRGNFEDGQKLARETQGIHAPLASRLGVHRLKWELEDLAFRMLEPDTYRQLALQLASRRASRESYIQDFIAGLKANLAKASIQAQVQGRPKHIYSIFKKMQRKKVAFSDLYDLNGVRVIVSDIPTCYRVLALVHDLWEPVPEEFDDYIARPKDNGYQSLHTVIRGPQGVPVEVQIRTESMHTLAEYGMAAHWRYKEGGRQDPVLEHTVAALRRSLQTGEEGGDWFAGQIFVLTPRQEVVCLPQGATPIGVAYTIHTEVGHRCRGARVNGRIVPLNYRLKTGEQVEILTAKEGGPNRAWLDLVQTDHARQRIRQWFKQREAEAFRRLGQQRLERELKRLEIKEIDWPRLLQRLRLHRPEEVWLAIGRGQIARGQLVAALRATAASQATVPKTPASPSFGPSSGTIPTLCVHGERNLLTQLARCCQPTPGEAVVGYLTVQHRITIHRLDCPNIVHLPETRRSRLVEAVWK
ncbi:MAG: HD domain-containing protein [Methylohalobius sp.]|nr:HD domain-containing protein [Methylohalobius sp.]